MAIQTSIRSEDFRNTIQESRQRFLNILSNQTSDNDEKSRQYDASKKRTSSRKISFKTRRTSSTYRKNYPTNIQKTTITASTVAELASRFNDIIERNNTSNEDVRLKKLVKKLSSNMKQTNLNIINEVEQKEVKKPGIKKKPVLDEKVAKVQIIRKKSSISSIPKRTMEIKKETVHPGHDGHEKQIRETEPVVKENNKRKPSGFVKAAIENFERKNVEPIITKRSMSESHKLNVKGVIENDANRRKSCKPDIELPKNSEREMDKPEDVTWKKRIIRGNQQENCKIEEVVSELKEQQPNSVPVVELEKELKDETDSNRIEEVVEMRKIEQKDIKPNASFLWTRVSSSYYQDIANQASSLRATFSGSHNETSFTARPVEIIETKDSEVYEELEDGYEPFDTNANYEVIASNEIKQEESDYEELQNVEENIYETLPSVKQEQFTQDRPTSKSSGSYCTIKNEESVSNCYESICAAGSTVTDGNYESIYFGEFGVRKDSSEKDIAGSIVSSEQKTNSLYGTSLRSWNDGIIYNGSATSDISFSDRSEWIDVSENEEEGGSKIIIIKEAVKNKKSGNWSEQCRKQWNKSSRMDENQKGADSDSDHLYETLDANDDSKELCYDSFASDTESENSFDNLDDQDESCDQPLPAVPNSNDVLARLAASATKHMRKFTKNLSMTKNDISKSLTRIARRKSRNDINEITDNNYDNSNETITPPSGVSQSAQTKTEVDENNEKNKTLSRKGFLNRIRRSIIMSPEQASEITSQYNSKGKSTFYLTPTINIDDPDDSTERKIEDDSGISLSPIDRHSRSSKNKLTRPQNPPPPAPIIALNEDLKKAFKEKRSTSWYAEVDLYKPTEVDSQLTVKRRNTCWYDEIGLYQKSSSTPSTSSAENSGTNTNITIRPTSASPNLKRIKDQADKGLNYRNSHNENDYYNNQSILSLNSNGTKTDVSLSSLPGDDIQMRLQNEPLYQFYDAAVLEYACHNGVSDFDSDNYEDVESRLGSAPSPQPRPSAMELTVPKRNSIAFTKTLWCEIPEVLQSSVLSTLSTHQKKLQEAKFEMVTSEASYLNSLNVLTDHFMKNLRSTLTENEFELLFGKIEAVRQCSDKLLLDLEKCWQDNILLHGVCDIIQKHAEEDFSVYIPFCENHMLLEQMMKKLRDRSSFSETLKQLEASPVCQCLSLYSFLMLPMQRITRWPLLLDAVLKRLEPHDPEYVTCQYVLATTNKIVNQCNEAARNKERELEMLRIENKMEWSKGVPSIELTVPNRWLVRSGTVVQVQPKSDDIKLTFGRKFSKVTLHLFLFNDLFIVTKPKSDDQYSVLHYCSRNFTEISTSDEVLSLPGKDMSGKYLFFLTILENQHRKTIEFLFSCSSETDKQRWIEALSPPKSEDPDEVLYECWDCPQVTVIHNYAAVQPDELSLSMGDIINVSKKMADGKNFSGWYQGERIRDGQTGWFPANYTTEIANPHVRARNLKQRYRLLTFSENYLKNK